MYIMLIDKVLYYSSDLGKFETLEKYYPNHISIKIAMNELSLFNEFKQVQL